MATGASGGGAIGRTDGASSARRTSELTPAKTSSTSAPTMTLATILRILRRRSTSAGSGNLADTSLNDADDRRAAGEGCTPGFGLTPPTNGNATIVECRRPAKTDQKRRKKADDPSLPNIALCAGHLFSKASLL